MFIDEMTNEYAYQDSYSENAIFEAVRLENKQALWIFSQFGIPLDIALQKATEMGKIDIVIFLKRLTCNR